MSKEAMKLSQDLRTLADRFSEGWHDGIKIDASDIMLLTDAAATLAEQPAHPVVPDAIHHTDLSESLEYIQGWNDCRAAMFEGKSAQQEPVERGGLRFYTNGIERQHWKADGSIDFKDKQGNVTMTIAAGSITSPQPSKPTEKMVVAAARVLSDRQAAACNVDCGDMWKLYGNDFIDDARAALEAAHGIKENT